MKPMSEIIIDLRVVIQRGLELEAKATPGPWREGKECVLDKSDNGPCIATDMYELDVPFIVTARNQYRALLEAVSKFLPRHHPYIMPDCQCPTCTILRTLHSALCEEGK